MATSPTRVAAKLIDEGPGGLADLRVYVFEDLEDDEEALDEARMEQLRAEFSAEFDAAESALSEGFGKPSRTGTDDDKAIPLNGVERFAVWSVDDQELFLAFAQEDDGLPLLLMLGTADG